MTTAGPREDWIVRGYGALCGEIEVPGDKSISHRAVMLASIADGTTEVRNFLDAADPIATLRIFQAMGVQIEHAGRGHLRIEGVGRDGLRAPTAPLDCGNAGTAMRLLAGLLAGQRFDSELAGDASLSKRPMARVTEPLQRMGALVQSPVGDLPPLRITGARALHGIDYATPVPSAQIKSAVLLAGVYASGSTCVREMRPTRDYTESMLRHFGYPVEYAAGRALVMGGGRLTASDVEIPADFSAAAFWLLAATIVPDSKLSMSSVGFEPHRSGLWRALGLMGAALAATPGPQSTAHHVARLEARSASLHGVELPVALVPDMIDEMPALFVAACLAHGDTLVTGAAELRVKESDRISVMVRALTAMGARIDERPDGALIRGGTKFHAAEVDAAGDHRCAMALAIAALAADAEVRIGDCANVATSYPGFADQLRRLGACVTVEVDAPDPALESKPHPASEKPLP